MLLIHSEQQSATALLSKVIHSYSFGLNHWIYSAWWCSSSIYFFSDRIIRPSSFDETTSNHLFDWSLRIGNPLSCEDLSRLHNVTFIFPLGNTVLAVPQTSSQITIKFFPPFIFGYFPFLNPNTYKIPTPNPMMCTRETYRWKCGCVHSTTHSCESYHEDTDTYLSGTSAETINIRQHCQRGVNGK